VGTGTKHVGEVKQ